MSSKLKKNNFEILVISHKDDYKCVKNLQQLLENNVFYKVGAKCVNPKVELHCELIYEDDSLTPELDFSLSKALVVFLFATESFSKDDWSVFEGRVSLDRVFNKKNKHKLFLYVVHTEPEKCRNYTLPSTLESVHDLYFSRNELENEKFYKSVQTILESNVSIQIRKDYELFNERVKFFSENQPDVLRHYGLNDEGCCKREIQVNEKQLVVGKCVREKAKNFAGNTLSTPDYMMLFYPNGDTQVDAASVHNAKLDLSRLNTSKCSSPIGSDLLGVDEETCHKMVTKFQPGTANEVRCLPLIMQYPLHIDPNTDIQVDTFPGEDHTADKPNHDLRELYISKGGSSVDCEHLSADEKHCLKMAIHIQPGSEAKVSCFPMSTQSLQGSADVTTCIPVSRQSQLDVTDETRFQFLPVVTQSSQPPADGARCLSVVRQSQPSSIDGGKCFPVVRKSQSDWAEETRFRFIPLVTQSLPRSIYEAKSLSLFRQSLPGCLYEAKSSHMVRHSLPRTINGTKCRPPFRQPLPCSIYESKSFPVVKQSLPDTINEAKCLPVLSHSLPSALDGANFPVVTHSIPGPSGELKGLTVVGQSLPSTTNGANFPVVTHSIPGTSGGFKCLPVVSQSLPGTTNGPSFPVVTHSIPGTRRGVNCLPVVSQSLPGTIDGARCFSVVLHSPPGTIDGGQCLPEVRKSQASIADQTRFRFLPVVTQSPPHSANDARYLPMANQYQTGKAVITEEANDDISADNGAVPGALEENAANKSNKDRSLLDSGYEDVL